MIVKQAHIGITRGDSFYFAIFFRRNGEEVAFSQGDKIYFTLKDNVDTEEILVQKIITEFTDGRAVISLEPNDTKNLAFKRYVYDIQYTKADGFTRTLILPSDFTIKPEVTYD